MRIILVRPQQPRNIGSAARVMKNFGLSDLVLVAPQRELNDEAFALATHAKDVLENATIVQTTQEAIADRAFVIGTTARVQEPRKLMTFTHLETLHRLLIERVWP